MLCRCFPEEKNRSPRSEGMKGAKARGIGLCFSYPYLRFSNGFPSNVGAVSSGKS